MQHILFTDGCPAKAIEAAAWFHECRVQEVARLLGDTRQLASIVIVLPRATYDHNDWRVAAARDLARRYAPRRINIVAGEPGSVLTETCDYLERAAGVTGQYLALSRADD
ncbi:MAG: Rossmann fold domain-containing protein [Pontixanthobacter sp.]